MELILRRGEASDAQACGAICFEAFKDVASEHGFSWEFPSASAATLVVRMLLAHAGVYAIVAELDGAIVGSSFLDERNPIRGLGPVSVALTARERTIGRRLVRDALDRAAQSGAPGVRLVQNAYDNRSLCLYVKLGFEIREPLARMDGPPVRATFPDHVVRRATAEDLPVCNALCLAVHGHHREGELAEAILRGTARVVEHLGKITGYATRVAYPGHAVAETNRGLMALIAATPQFGRGGFLLPTRNSELFRWCLDNGLHLVHLMNLMAIGLYNEPDGVCLPSAIY